MIPPTFFKAFLVLSYLFISSGYIQLSTLKSKSFHKILINQKIKTDFKKITSNDAYQIASFWYDELEKVGADEGIDHKCDIHPLSKTNNILYEKSANLTDYQYNIINDIENKNHHYIWRPKIQICLPTLRSVNIDDDFPKTLLCPSFRETMYLLSLEGRNESLEDAIIRNIVQSPYWNKPEHESYNILQYSVERFFIDYLKYPCVKYK